ncbi:MAG: septal ring lytic transglycosylase RlpA family protein [Rhodothalassiaceae bacterium]
MTRRHAIRRLFVPGIPAGLLLALGACSSGPPLHIPGDGGGPVGAQRVGDPYQVAGVWYYPEADDNYDAVGLASWYGREFHGRRTANGEIFNMNKLTAAHPTLPLPSRVRVTNLENGRSLIVRVNDRGPFARGRIIDLSRRAAQLLGFEKQGTTRVRVQLVRNDGSIADNGGRSAIPRRLAKGESPAGPLFVQVGSFTEYRNARRLRRALKDLGEVRIEKARADGRRVWRVRLGPFETLAAAERMLDRIRHRGFYEARIFTDRLG